MASDALLNLNKAFLGGEVPQSVGLEHLVKRRGKPFGRPALIQKRFAPRFCAISSTRIAQFRFKTRSLDWCPPQLKDKTTELTAGIKSRNQRENVTQ